VRHTLPTKWPGKAEIAIALAKMLMAQQSGPRDVAEQYRKCSRARKKIEYRSFARYYNEYFNWVNQSTKR
jgi:hypothetical protein